MRDLLHGLMALPPVGRWVLAGLVFVLIGWAVTAVRSRLPVRKDPVRLFTDAQRQEAFRRAGRRCEHKPPLWFRCTATPTHGDHVYPHSRGGPTTAGNLQALCAPHNLAKSSRVPSKMSTWRLSRRRRRYFPPGAPTAVSRRRYR